jgi:hypothetical protein
MKLAQIALAFSFLGAVAQADVSFSGKSAEYMFDVLSNRGNVVSTTAGRSILRSPLERKLLHPGQRLMECQAKSGWVFKTYFCSFPGTDAYDIVGRKTINLSSSDSQEFDDILNALVELDWELNRTRALQITGRSAERLFTKLNGLTKETDSTVFRRTGKSPWLGRPVAGVGINEMYCQRTDGRVFTSYKCVVRGITVADSNAPLNVITD